jgi:hypothetical protein
MLLELAVAHCLASEAGVAGGPATGGRPCALSFLAVRMLISPWPASAACYGFAAKSALLTLVYSGAGGRCSAAAGDAHFGARRRRCAAGALAVCHDHGCAMITCVICRSDCCAAC